MKQIYCSKSTEHKTPTQCSQSCSPRQIAECVLRAARLQAQNAVHQVGDVWKDPIYWDKQGQWKVQGPNGRLTYRTKRQAVMVSTHMMASAGVN